MRQASLDLLGLDGRSAHQCVLDLDDAIDDIKEHPMTYAEIGRSLPPDWGNPKQYEDWLISFRDACLRHPYAKVEYSRS